PLTLHDALPIWARRTQPARRLQRRRLLPAPRGSGVPQPVHALRRGLPPRAAQPGRGRHSGEARALPARVRLHAAAWGGPAAGRSLLQPEPIPRHGGGAARVAAAGREAVARSRRQRYALTRRRLSSPPQPPAPPATRTRRRPAAPVRPPPRA